MTPSLPPSRRERLRISTWQIGSWRKTTLTFEGSKAHLKTANTRKNLHEKHIDSDSRNPAHAMGHRRARRLGFRVLPKRPGFHRLHQSPSAPFAFHAALLGFNLSSTVTAGENRGLRLHHAFTALTMSQATYKESAKRFKPNCPWIPRHENC